MAALCAVSAIISVVVPFAGGIALVGTVPAGLLAYRYRLRVLMTMTVAAGMIAFLIAGMGAFMAVIQSAYIGGLTGIVKRKGRGTPTVIVTSVFAGAAFAAANVAALMALTRLRHLMRDAITANVDGLATFLTHVHLPQVGSWIKGVYALSLQYWQLVLIGIVTVGVLVVSLVGWWALSRLLERMRGIPDVHKLDAPAGDLDHDAAIGPVPVQLDNVRFRYPGVDQDALRELSMELQVGEHVAITGANGSGKTTLMLILSGREPTSGTVHRPGAVGLGKPGGTAVVLQHPESQVLGTRVADDVVWGLPPGTKIDVEALLAEVGLEDLAERDTGSLSGGELQRLALAAAMAREPAILIADEVTTMVDQQGRNALLSVLSGLTRRHRTALVHITHYSNEAESADRTIKLSDSPDNTEMAPATDAALPGVGEATRAPALELVGVGHEYGIGTPWAKTALRDINFVVEQGDGVLIHGGNGSGKSTLAWIMAGLTTPTSGVCLLDGEPTSEQVGAVALSFQAARLQLMRSRVDLEVASAAGFSHKDEGRVTAALGVVGLDPALAKRSIDQLSGGQMRRVVLAGLLACAPKALILDEPLAGLDAASQLGLVRLLEDLRREQGLTVVVISSDCSGLESLCPRTLQLNAGVLESAPAAAVRGLGRG